MNPQKSGDRGKRKCRLRWHFCLQKLNKKVWWGLCLLSTIFITSGFRLAEMYSVFLPDLSWRY